MANIEKTEPARSASEVTFNDSNQIDPTRAIYVGSTGNVKVDFVDGSTVTFSSVSAGTLLPIRVNRIYSTGTTATDVIALY